MCSKRSCRNCPVVINCIRMALQDVLPACNTCTWHVRQDFLAVCLPIEDVETIDRCFASVLSKRRGMALSSARSKRLFLFQKLRITLDTVHQAARYGCLRSVAARVDGPGLEHTVVGPVCLPASPAYRCRPSCRNLLRHDWGFIAARCTRI